MLHSCRHRLDSGLSGRSETRISYWEHTVPAQSLREGVPTYFRAVPPFLASGGSGRGPGGSAGDKLPLPRLWWQRTGGPGGSAGGKLPPPRPWWQRTGGQGVVPEASSPFLARSAGEEGGRGEGEGHQPYSTAPALNPTPPVSVASRYIFGQALSCVVPENQPASYRE